MSLRRSHAVRPEEGWSGLVDLHSHVLPGVDDGADSFDDSVAMATAAEREGISVLAATPHVRDDFPTRSATMHLLVEDVRERLRSESVSVDVRPGGEVGFGMIAELGLDELRRFCLAGNPRYLLVETPYHGWPLGIAETLFTLRLGGMTPVLAHPERNPLVQEDPERLRPLVDSGTLMQLTASSLDGRTSKRVAKTAHRLLKLELAHLVASDEALGWRRHWSRSEMSTSPGGSGATCPQRSRTSGHCPTALRVRLGAVCRGTADLTAPTERLPSFGCLRALPWLSAASTRRRTSAGC